MPMSVITRFAPSPTGFLHIGGARTALFNWLYAKRHGGKMLLRIEDTDRERSTEPAIKAILDGLTWLGLDWDGDVVYQFSRAARHQEVAESLLAPGRAYHCYASQEELEAMREQARQEGKPLRYDGRWRDRDPVRGSGRRQAGHPPEGAAGGRDRGRGRTCRAASSGRTRISTTSCCCARTARRPICWPSWSTITTWTSPMSSAATTTSPTRARQTQIYQALGWTVPSMAHIPLIHGPDGAKLSKRHGALGVEAYRSMGYLPGGVAQLSGAPRLEPRRPGDLLAPTR